MSAPRPKRKRATVSYYVPTEFDDIDEAEDNVAADEQPDETDVTEVAVKEQQLTSEPEPDTDTDSDSDSESDSDSSSEDSDEDFTPYKRKSKKKPKKKVKKAKKPKKKKNVPFRILDLPPEIRNMIYTAALVETAKDLTFFVKTNSRTLVRGSLKKKHAGWRWGSGQNGTWSIQREKAWDKNRTPLIPALLRINRAIHDEALPVLYGQTFHFETPIALNVFMSVISPANRLLLHSIVIRGWHERGNWRRDLFPAFNMLTTAPNIRHILLDRRVVDENDGKDRSPWDPTGFWVDIRPWANIVDAAKGKGTAKSIIEFTTINFGSKKEIEDGSEHLERRKKAWMDALQFSVKPSDKPSEEPSEKATKESPKKA